MSELLRFDWAAKHLLRDKANFGILEGFLSELLKTEIVMVELLESESNRADENDKQDRLHLCVQNSQQELILIEIQTCSERDLFWRLCSGAPQGRPDLLWESMSRDQVKKIILVYIIYFELTRGKDYLYHGTSTFTGVYKQDELELNAHQQQFFQFDQVNENYPERYLINFRQFQDMIRAGFDEWAYFLKHEEIKDEFQAKNIHLAREKLDVLKLPLDERRQYEAYLEGLRYEKSMFETNRRAALLEGEQIGLEKGEQIGLEKGEQIGLQKSILVLQKTLHDLLQQRFGEVPAAVSERLAQLTDLSELQTALARAVVCASVAEFERDQA